MIRTMIDTFLLEAIKIQMKQLSSMHTTLASYTQSKGISACVCNNMQSHEDEIRQYLLPHFRHF